MLLLRHLRYYGRHSRSYFAAQQRGSNSKHNLTTACKRCNKIKAARDKEELRRYYCKRLGVKDYRFAGELKEAA
jgi:succinate dehydrogenase/fumarate reductase flavoprotein subunit